MKKTLADADVALFHSEMADVEPLQSNVVEPYRRKLPPQPRPQPQLDSDKSTWEQDVTGREIPEYLLYRRPGLQQRVLYDLQRGRIPTLLELDLHGLTSAYAYETLCEFLNHCREHRIRCVRIIHGKGGRSPGQQPVLKGKLNHWLRQQDDVLAFCSTPRHDGGTGALYVLLRNPQKNQRS